MSVWWYTNVFMNSNSTIFVAPAEYRKAKLLDALPKSTDTFHKYNNA